MEPAPAALAVPRPVPIAPAEDAARRMRDFLVGPGARLATLEQLTGEVGERLAGLGVPLSRLNISVRVLSATETVRSYLWRPGQPIAVRSLLWGGRDRELYERSPYKTAHDTGEWVDLVIAEVEDDRYGIIPDLRDEGVTHYLVAPLELSNGERSGVTFGASHPAGFDARARTILADMYPTLANVIDHLATRLALQEVLSIYVGGEPARSILDGSVHRGQVKRIQSAIMFADLKSFTTRSKDLSAEDAAELLNAYYDCVVPAVEAHQGNVLKFMGDGVLAIFPSRNCGAGKACDTAFTAATAVIEKASSTFWHGEPLTSRVALHYGDAAYGNVGSGDRLDFTVVGRDVNLASRVAGLGSRLDEQLLASREFAQNLPRPMERLGAFAVRGFDEPLEVYRPLAAADAASAQR
jgi:adenylate cyclase